MRCSLQVLRSLLFFASSIFLQVLVSLFQIEKRVGDRLQKWQEDVDKELEQQREAAKFHARPATILVSLELKLFPFLYQILRLKNREHGFIFVNVKTNSSNKL
jgi:p-aminobenzoyl-glutamate transporter AbgT